PTGMDENNLFMITQQWVGAPSGDDPASIQKLDAMLNEDIQALRVLPDVESVTPINTLPLYPSSWNGSVSLKPGAELGAGNTRTTYYFGDENMMKTLGLRLVAGRNFTASDVTNKGFRDPSEASMVIITKALADKLFPKGDAVGKVAYLDGATTPSTVVGEVERLQVPSVSSWASSFVWNSTIEPVRLNSNFSRYAVRTKPGRLNAVMRAVPSRLYGVNPMRVLNDDSVKSFKDIRAEAYRADIGMAALMGVICVILLAVTAAGIVGLTSFWVGQRHRQIGVRRALGARKIDILHYFQLENMLIAGGGALVGIALAIGLNRMLMSKFEMDSMPVYYVLAGLAVVVLLGQIAVFVPALRASNVPPVAATRSA
ncbi:MAG TPA: FtsX-like permease family protein, partial [Dyella sp.]|uniref:ABC transporter permease n=1 Tax=Dyella sp. TaxID=1869338 RepID=UPI002C12177D